MLAHVDKSRLELCEIIRTLEAIKVPIKYSDNKFAVRDALTNNEFDLDEMQQKIMRLVGIRYYNFD